MGFVSDLKNIIGRRGRERTYAKMLNGQIPVFSSCGKDIYAYDIMRNAVMINCEEMAKITPRHIRMNGDNVQETVKSDINRLLEVAPNPYMTVSDFLWRCNYLYETTDNCYIYPAYKKQWVNETQYKRIYTGFYPIAPVNVEFFQNSYGEIIINFRFENGDEAELPYADIIHWKKNMTDNDITGGSGRITQADTSVMNLLNADSTAIQGIDKGVKEKFNVRGLYKYNQMIDEETINKKITEFEEKIKKSNSGILGMDIKSEYVPLNIDPKLVDKNTMEFIERRILARVGVPLEVYNRKFTEEEYQGYYEMTLEGRIKSFGEAFSKALFTASELEVGDRVVAFQQGLIYSSLKNKISAVEILSQVGVLTGNQIAAIFGYAPYEGGDVRRVSLNYIDANYITEYQLGKIKSGNLNFTEDNGGAENGGKEQ